MTILNPIPPSSSFECAPFCSVAHDPGDPSDTRCMTAYTTVSTSRHIDAYITAEGSS